MNLAPEWWGMKAPGFLWVAQGAPGLKDSWKEAALYPFTLGLTSGAWVILPGPPQPPYLVSLCPSVSWEGVPQMRGGDREHLCSDPSPSPGLPFRAVTLPQLYLPAPLTKPPPDHTLPFSSLPSPFCSHLAEVWTQDPSRWWMLGSVCDPQEDLAPRTCSGRRRRGSPLCGRRAQHAESPGCWGCTCSLCPQVSPGSAAGGTSGSKRTGTRTLSPH